MGVNRNAATIVKYNGLATSGKEKVRRKPKITKPNVAHVVVLAELVLLWGEAPHVLHVLAPGRWRRGDIDARANYVGGSLSVAASASLSCSESPTASTVSEAMTLSAAASERTSMRHG